MRPRILVLLSLYNGEKYLREQVESVMAQEGDFELTLRIRDDGSTDGSPALVRELSESYPGRIEYEKGENLGYNASFFTLLRAAEGFDYYALCDQDDVWLPEKIRCAVRRLSAEDGTRPLLYSAVSVLTDESLRPVGMTRKQQRPFTLYNTLIQNICPGHNQVLNEPLMALVRQTKDISPIYVYDLWIENLAVLKGEILFDNEAHTLYRQHGDNELGSRGSSLGKLLRAGKRALAGEGEKNKKQMSYFASCFRDEPGMKQVADDVNRLLMAKSFSARLKLALRCPFWRQSRIESTAFRLSVLTGKY